MARAARPLVCGSIFAVREYPMPFYEAHEREPFSVYEVEWDDGLTDVVTDEGLMPCFATPAMAQFAIAQEAALARLPATIDDAARIGGAAEQATQRLIDDAESALSAAQQAIQKPRTS